MTALANQALPMLMLPVRLETVYAQGNPPKIRIRIYPDACHLDSHDPRLSPEEVSAGKLFWRHWGKAKAKPAQLSEWRRFAQTRPPRRALFIARMTRQGRARAKRKDGETTLTQVSMLPAKWIVRGYSSGNMLFEAESQPVQAPLYASPDPAHFAGADIRPDSPIGWMVNFERAVEVGMAIEASLGIHQRGGFDRFVVYGVPRVRRQDTALANHLAAKRWTDGAGFAPQGMPTNNTEGAESAWTREPTDLDLLFAQEFPQLVPDIDRLSPVPGAITASARGGAQNTNAAVLGKALGLADIDELKKYDFAMAGEGRLQSLMNRLVWPVTGGSYLSELLRGQQGDFFSAADWRWIRTMFTNEMRGGASLPALRFGATPYGIALTTTNLEESTQYSKERRLAAFLKQLKPLWMDAGAGVEKVTDGAAQADPGAALAALLARVPDPASFALRRLHDREFGLTFIYDLLRLGYYELAPDVERVDQYIRIRLDANEGIPDAFDFVSQQRGSFDNPYFTLNQLDLRYPPGTAVDPTGLVQLSNGQFLRRNRPNHDDIVNLNNLLRSSIQLFSPTQISNTARDLFKSIAEVRILIERVREHLNEHDARNSAFATPGIPAGLFRGPMGSGHVDPVIAYGLYEENSVNWPLRHLLTIEQVAAPESYLTYLAALARYRLGEAPEPSPVFAPQEDRPLAFHLLEHAIALTVEHIAANQAAGGNGGAARGDLTGMAQALDILATLEPQAMERLLRQSLGLSGLRLDAWATGLLNRHLRRQRTAKPTGLKVGAFGVVEDLPAYHDDEAHAFSESFVHTPSLTHAKTAAVLRAGWQARGSDPGARSPLAVDLSSARMKRALWLFGAVAQGADLGDLLGSQIERDLTDSGFAHLIDPLRHAVLKLTSSEPDPATPIVDGLDAIALYDNGTGLADLQTALEYRDGTAPSEPDKIGPPLAVAASTLDAMADATLADATFALVQGQPATAGAALSAIADASAPLPKLDVLKTPALGPVISNTVALFARSDTGDGWPASTSLRAALNPAGERLARRLLGPAQLIILTAEIKDHRQELTLNVLLDESGASLGALDLLSMAEAGTSQTPLAAFFQRITADLVGEEAAIATPETAETIARFVTWRNVLFGARPLQPRDWQAAVPDLEDDVPDVVTKYARQQASAALQRLAEIVAGFKQLIQDLRSTLPAPAEGDPHRIEPGLPAPPLLAALRAVAPFNHWRLREIPTGVSSKELQRQAWRVLDALRKQQADLPDLESARANLDTAAKVIAAAAKCLFGPGPGWTPLLPPAAQRALAKASVTGRTQLAASTLSPFGWLSDIGKISPALRRLGDAIIAETLHDRAGFGYALAQSGPAKEPWCATAAPDDGRGRSGLLMLTDGPHTIAATGGYAALVVDTCVERIPVAERDTALAVELESPNAEPPQVMALALNPTATRWTPDHAFAAILELLDWSLCRPVDPVDLPDFDQHLPAAFTRETLRDTAERYADDEL